MSIQSLILPYLPRVARNAFHRIEASPLGYRIARGAFWSISGAVVSRALMLFANIIVARILSCEVYGELGMIRSTVNMFIVFAGFGLGLTATKHVAEFRESDPDRAGRIMALSGIFSMFMGAIITLLLIFSAPWLCIKTINAPHLIPELRFAAIILLISAINGAQTGSLAGLEAFKTIAIVNLWVGVFSMPMLICGAYYGGLSGCVLAIGANIGVNWILNHIALRVETKRYSIQLSFKNCFKEWPVLWKFSLPSALSGIMVGPVMWICNALLVNQKNGYEQLGIFDAANQWRLAILFIPTIVSQIVLPMLSNLNGTGDHDSYINILKMNIVINTLVSITIVIPIILISPWIMSAYGENFKGGNLTFIILSLSTILNAMNNVIGQAIASKSQMWFGFLFNCMWGMALLTLSYLLVGKYQALGLSLAYLISYVLHAIWQSFYLFKILNFYK